MLRYKASLGRVHDLIEVREMNETLTLRVDADPVEIMRVIQSLGRQIENDKDTENADGFTKAFCTAIFGEAQTAKLYEFYNNEMSCVLSICSKYFSERLGKLITKAQKRARI